MEPDCLADNAGRPPAITGRRWRLGLLALAALIVVGLLGPTATDGRERPGGSASRAISHRAAQAPLPTLRPWTAAEERFCVLAALSIPLHLQEMSRFDGTAEDRAGAAANLRDWTRQLREAAPPEIAGSVEALTRLSDRSYDALERGDSGTSVSSPELEAARTSPEARRAQQRGSDYMRQHCGIDFGDA